LSDVCESSETFRLLLVSLSDAHQTIVWIFVQGSVDFQAAMLTLHLDKARAIRARVEALLFTTCFDGNCAPWCDLKIRATLKIVSAYKKYLTLVAASAIIVM
jgi:hypothetical protein